MISKDTVKQFVDHELAAHSTRRGLLAPGLTTLQRLTRIQQSKLKARSENDILTVMWLDAKLKRYMGTTVEYHRVEEAFHVNCACVCDKLMYKPIDELLAVFLVLLYREF
ncbi:hypothetical protein Pmani_001003 [Petrolisthes manimaculis]|uniref:Uncharacterized protein n=1 Tax=Petrolisthes manimaculis TaxID=1843537 RepID=A0AAE1QL87_9EUCA|nr:hypothetical protein Pmani_001003 [Petrolisthes manimaculis]